MSSLALTKPAKNSPMPRDPKDKSKETLSLKEARFIHHYTDINSHTYGNATRSYEISHDKTNLNTCAVEGYKLLRKEKIRYAIQKIESIRDQKGKVRTSRLESVLNGDYVQIQTRKRVTEAVNPLSGQKEKLVTEDEYTKTPSAGEVVAAANVLNKMDGTYNTQEAMGSLLSLELKTAFKKSMKESKPAGIQRILDAQAAEIDQELPLNGSNMAENAQKHGVYTNKVATNTGEPDDADNGDVIINCNTSHSTLSPALDSSADAQPQGNDSQATIKAQANENRGEGGTGSTRAHKIPPSPTDPTFSNLSEESLQEPSDEIDLEEEVVRELMKGE
jgi:hypothetical protein